MEDSDRRTELIKARLTVAQMAKARQVAKEEKITLADLLRRGLEQYYHTRKCLGGN